MNYNYYNNIAMSINYYNVLVYFPIKINRINM